MTQLRCPETPEECGRIGSRGMWSHLHNKHGWDKDEATQWVRRQTGGSDDDEPDSGAAATSDGETEDEVETPESRPNQSESEFQFDPEREDPEQSPEPGENEVPNTDEDAVVVDDEGSEKLSPDGFDSRNRPEMSPPEDSDLPEDVTPDDFEPEETDSPDPVQQNHEQDDDETDDSGGVLNKLRNRGSDDAPEDDSESSTEEIVEEADDPEEQERRQRVLDALNGDHDDENSDETPDRQPNQTEQAPSGRESGDSTPKPAQMQNGMVVDENLLQTLFGLPFDQAANVTGWDGWRLSSEEKEANARLLQAWADEQNIELGTGVMLAMSLGSTVGGRAVAYARHRKQENSEETASQSPNPDPPERQHSEPRETTDSPPESETAQSQQTEQSADQFDFDQPIGQQPAGA